MFGKSYKIFLTTCRPATAYKRRQGGTRRQKHVLKRLPSKQVGGARARSTCPLGVSSGCQPPGHGRFLPAVFPQLPVSADTEQGCIVYTQPCSVSVL
ncbi:unnamed protein product [Staurois parvus]|uniref:Uncharacterized protein n=1 Tax=Staurois parvus TaxID=386267 RepID=A0ABN9B2Q6_9NEOB|nr:unnamed protein product [Staurois parvus]